VPAIDARSCEGVAAGESRRGESSDRKLQAGVGSDAQRGVAARRSVERGGRWRVIECRMPRACPARAGVPTCGGGSRALRPRIRRVGAARGLQTPRGSASMAGGERANRAIGGDIVARTLACVAAVAASSPHPRRSVCPRS
jgi:hypothetical protein